MQKPLLLLMAPVNTVSGYGARSRDIAHTLIASDKYDVKIWPTRWGSTPQNYLNVLDEKDKLILDRCLTDPKLPAQPDVFIQITVPNEFQRIGKYNIGITAGIETTIAAAPWVEGCNQMDLVLTSSEHSKKVLLESVWEKHDQQSGQPVGTIRVECPVEVLFEGVDLETYFKTNNIHLTVCDQLNQVKEDFAFLFVGHWLKGGFGEDRKNISGLIKTFLETFKNKSKDNKPALILKTSAADFSPIDRQETLTKIDIIRRSIDCKESDLPNIYFIHGDLTNDEMNSLYNHPKVKAHITFTKGEGYGRPLAEASLSEKIVIAPAWSGHLDFLKHSVQLPGTLTNVDASAAWENVILQESLWFSVDYNQAANAMKQVADKKNAKMFAELGKRQAYVIKSQFSLDNMSKSLLSILDKYTNPTAQPIQQTTLKLPQLKTLQIPKLKKVEHE